MADGAFLLVLEPGLQTTVQDLGRPGLMRIGVTPGGALDRAALVLGNRLVGNDPGAAALEVTLLGPRLRFTGAAVVAIVGGDLAPTLDGAPLPLLCPVAVPAGGEVAFAPGAAPTTGARCYLCVAGGIAVPEVMGSRSTDLAARFGGWHGRALQSGDELPLGPAGGSPDELLRRRLVHPPPAHDPAQPIRVVLGPQSERFAAAGVTTFLNAAYVVSLRSDRMGLRLDGPVIAHAAGADLVSEGIAHGAVQVPGDGHPIVLLAARQTIGGYPKIATVAAADLDALGQRRPGDPVRFTPVDVREARALALAYHAGLGEDAVTTSLRPGSGWVGTSSGAGGRDDDVADAWNPTAVARLVDALRAADVASFRIEVASAGLKLDVHWKTSGGPSAATGPTDSEGGGSSSDNKNEVTVKAPLLGVFFRRPAPDQDAFTEEGRAVQAGQTIGLIEVMKTFHEVTAPRSGILAAFLVDDGATVEYGQPVARLRASQAAASS